MTALFNKTTSYQNMALALSSLLFVFSIAQVRCLGQRPDQNAPAPVYVETAILKSQENRQRFVGSLTPLRTSTVGSSVEGRIVKLNAELGELVGMLAPEKSDQAILGQAVAEVESDSLDIQIAAAQVELKSRTQAAQELKLSLPEDILLAEANVAQAQAQLVYAKDNYERQKNLSERGAGLSEREIAEALSVFRAQQHAHSAAKSTLQKLTATKQIKLEIAETSVLAQDKELERLAEELGRHTIRAPFQGAVVSKMADVGDWVTRGTPIVQVIQLDPIELTIQVPQQYLPKLQASMDQARQQKQANGKPGQPTAEITIEGFKDPMFGNVAAIVPQADLRTRSFPVVIRLPNPLTETGYALKPGMLAAASLNVGLDRDVVLINKDALVLGNTTIVVIAAPDKNNPSQRIAKPVPVSLGQSFGQNIEVLSGISAGDQVIVQGNESVRPGQPLKILKQ